MKKPKIKIRKFKKERAKEVCKLIIDCFNEFVAPSFSKKASNEYLARVTPEILIENSKSKERDIYVAIKNNQIIGIIEGVKNYRIVWLFVNKKFYKKGIGKKLVNKIESIFKKRGGKIMKIRSSLYSVKFYEKIGYKKSRGIVKTKKGVVFQPMKKIL